MAWQHLLSWGSLRGALAVTMVLLIPADTTVPGWTFDMSIRDFMLAITVGCIFATLFVKATTIRGFMRKLKLDALTNIETVEYEEAKALMHHEVADRLVRYTERGYISAEAAERLRSAHVQDFKTACSNVAKLGNTSEQLAHRVLRLFAIGIEKRHLKELYHHHEVNEAVYRRLTGKLQLQFEAIEAGNLAPNMSLHTDGKDVFEHMATWIHNTFTPETPAAKISNLYMYYRAQVILSRKVVKELTAIEEQHVKEIFTAAAFEHVVALYTTFKDQSQKKMEQFASEHAATTAPIAEMLALRGIHRIQDATLEELFERELITPKLKVTLEEEMHHV
jgi:CPA1 family monovalent cation:H+ antiporter